MDVGVGISLEKKMYRYMNAMGTYVPFVSLVTDEQWTGRSVEQVETNKIEIVETNEKLEMSQV